MDRTTRLLGAPGPVGVPVGLLVGLLVGVLVGCGQGGASPAADPTPSVSAPAPAPLDAGEPEGYQRYVALGDSYTAAPFVPSTQLTGCLRSSGNYPHLVAAELEGAVLEDRSCSGADTTHLRRPQQVPGGPVPPQLEPLDAETDLVTLGMGGNDFALFGTLVGRCVALRDVDPTGTPCADELGGSGQDPLRDAVGRIRSRVAAAVEEIQRRAPDARVLLVGYPQIIPASGTCPRLLPLADGDYAYARALNEELADAIEEAAADTGVGHVDVWAASEDRDICAADPWIAGSRSDPTRALAFHPYAAHQQAVADLILNQL